MYVCMYAYWEHACIQPKGFLIYWFTNESEKLENNDR